MPLGVGSSGFISPQRCLAVPESGCGFVVIHALFFCMEQEPLGGMYEEGFMDGFGYWDGVIGRGN